MITREKFEFLKNKYGTSSSWAIWKDPNDDPKSNIEDLGEMNITV